CLGAGAIEGQRVIAGLGRPGDRGGDDRKGRRRTARWVAGGGRGQLADGDVVVRRDGHRKRRVGEQGGDGGRVGARVNEVLLLALRDVQQRGFGVPAARFFHEQRVRGHGDGDQNGHDGNRHHELDERHASHAALRAVCHFADSWPVHVFSSLHYAGAIPPQFTPLFCARIEVLEGFRWTVEAERPEAPTPVRGELQLL